MSATGTRAAFGQIRRLPSKNYHARYLGPDGVRHNGPATWKTKTEARAWLDDERALLISGDWTPPASRRSWTPEKVARRMTLSDYATTWLSNRKRRDGDPIAIRTREHYRDLLDRLILPARDVGVATQNLGEMVLEDIADVHVVLWWKSLPATSATQNAHAYGVLSSIMKSAVAEGFTTSSPCRIVGASKSPDPVHEVIEANVDELTLLLKAMPPRLRAMIYVGAWTALRFGEVVELRRGDVDLTRRVIRVRRGVVKTRTEGHVVKATKSKAGRRDVPISDDLARALEAHLRDHVGAGRDALLFPAFSDETKTLATSTFMRHYHAARAKAGRPDLHFHDLRHTGLTWFAIEGATTKELMTLGGHASSVAAERYQRVARGRTAALAANLPPAPII